MEIFAATLPVTEPISPEEMTATCAPPERTLPLALIATFMMLCSAPKALIIPANSENRIMVLAVICPSMPNTPVKLVVE